MPHKLNQPLTTKFDEALMMASRLHREQGRKGTQVPYISHVLSVSALVLEFGGTETQAIAALLHDTVEDCGGMPVLKKIKARFGPKVAEIVVGCTDSFENGPKRDWLERKTAHLKHLRSLEPKGLLVVAADKLHNLTSIERDLRAGHNVWKRFNAEPPDQFWYYDSVVEILENRLKNSIVPTLRGTLERVRGASPQEWFARKQDHLNLPMPEDRRRMHFTRSYTEEQFSLIRKGFVPSSMDDKWFIYYEPEHSELYMHRSWTGFCIYTLKFQKEPGGYRISESWVNRDPEQYEKTDTEQDAKIASWLIDRLLFGREVNFPS